MIIHATIKHIVILIHRGEETFFQRTEFHLLQPFLSYAECMEFT